MDFVCRSLFWMEPPTLGSLMATFVAMATMCPLPPDLLNMPLSLLWKRPFALHLPLCYHSFPTPCKHMVMKTTKRTCMSMPWLMFILNNMVIIKMNMIIISGLVIPSLAIMVMRACLSSLPAMCTITGWCWSVPSLLFLRRSQKYHGRLCLHWALSFIVSQACITRSLHNLQWSNHALAFSTKTSSFITHPSKKSHAYICNGYLDISNKNESMWRWKWRIIMVVYLRCQCRHRWRALL